MRVPIIASLACAVAAPASAQCPPSKVVVELVADDTPSCVTITPDAELPELDITNNCADVQFHVEAGLDCPYCGPPLTLRTGTFGSFTVETRPLAAFTPQTPRGSHELTWAVGDQTGSLAVDVVPNIVPCAAPDMGSTADAGADMGAQPPESVDAGGCATTRHDPAWASVVGFLLVASRRRRMAR